MVILIPRCKDTARRQVLLERIEVSKVGATSTQDTQEISEHSSTCCLKLQGQRTFHLALRLSRSSILQPSATAALDGSKDGGQAHARLRFPLS